MGTDRYLWVAMGTYRSPPHVNGAWILGGQVGPIVETCRTAPVVNIVHVEMCKGVRVPELLIFRARRMLAASLRHGDRHT